MLYPAGGSVQIRDREKRKREKALGALGEPQLAARFGRGAACSACFVGVRRERLDLSVH